MAMKLAAVVADKTRRGGCICARKIHPCADISTVRPSSPLRILTEKLLQVGHWVAFVICRRTTCNTTNGTTGLDLWRFAKAAHSIFKTCELLTALCTDDKDDVCPECDGAGGWIDPPGSPYWVTCHVCHGSGKYTPEHCPADELRDRQKERNL